MSRLIDADALLEAFKEQGYLPNIVEILITNAPTVQREGWISVEDRLPDNDKQVMAWVKDKDNKFGG